MKSILLVALFAMFTLTACVVSPGPQGYGSITVSPLPAVIELGSDPYYYQNGYYYYYQNNNWRYSNTRNGPWVDLPRSHWPKEIRYRGRGNDQGRDRDDSQGMDYRQGHDRQ
jgi:hypothetical protein